MGSLSLSSPSVVGGEEFSITLSDASLNTNPGARESVTVTISADKENEPVHDVVLTETDINTGVFRGSAVTVPSSSAALPSPGIINVVRGSIVTVSSPAGLTEALTILSPGSVLVPPATAPGTPLLIEVYDPDVDASGVLREGVSVTVSVSCSGAVAAGCPADASARPAQASETVALKETGPQSSRFTGALQTFLQEGTAAPHAGAGDGAVDVRGRSSGCGPDVLRVSYQDGAPAGQRSAQSVAAFSGTVLLSNRTVDPSGDGSITVTVSDRDLHNVSSVLVFVSSSRLGEPSEQLTLQADGACSPVPTFSGSLATSPSGTPAEGDAAVVVAPGDLLTFTYADAAPAGTALAYARVADGGSVSLGPTRPLRGSLGAGSTVATVAPGGELTVTVSDLDLDQDPSVADAVTVSVSVPGDQEGVPLTETGPSTGVFTGGLPTREAATGEAGVLDGAAEGAAIAANYSDATAAGGPLVSAAAAGRVATRGAVSLAASSAAFEVGDAVVVTVVDPDLDELPAVRETVMVYVTVDDTGDAEVVELAEDSLSSGIFRGSVPTTTNASNHTGALLTTVPTSASGSIVRAWYHDTVPEGGRAARLKMCSEAAVSGGQAYFRAGPDHLIVTVSDADLNTDPLRAEVSEAWANSSLGAVRVALTESGIDSASFTGAVPTTTSASPPAGTLQVAAVGDIVNVTYSDSCPLAPRVPPTAPRSALPGALSANTTLVAAGAAVLVTVQDAALNQDPGASESWPSLANASVAGASPNFALLDFTETGPDTGVFTAMLETSASPGGGGLHLSAPSGAGSLPITVLLAEPIAGLEPTFLTLQTQRVGLVSLGRAGCDPGRFEVGQPLEVTVTDADLSHMGSASAQVTLGVGADSETVTVTPTGPYSGVFTGSIPTSSAAGAPADGTVGGLSSGDVVAGTYQDQDGASRAGQGAAGAVGVIAFANRGSDTDTGGVLTVDTDVLLVTVTDPDLNQDSGAAEAYLTHGAGGEGVLIYRIGIDDFAVFITETGADTGVFTADINFRQPSNIALPSCVGFINNACSISRLQATSPSDPAEVWNRALIEYQDPDIPSTTGGRVKGLGANRVQKYIAPGSDGSVEAAPTPFVAGSYLEITVRDQDRSMYENAVETLEVTVSSSRAGELDQTVTCTEASLESSTFVGRLRTFDLPSVNTAGVGFMHVSDADVLTVAYSDYPKYLASAAATVRNTPSPVVVVGRFSCVGGAFAGQSCAGLVDLATCGEGQCRASTGALSAGPGGSGGASIIVGERLAITVTDADGDADPLAPGTVSVTGSNQATADRETVSLTETGNATGVYTGRLPTLSVGVSGAGAQQDGTLLVSPGDAVSLQYDDQVPFLSVSTLLTVVDGTAGSIAVDPPYVPPGGLVRVVLNDTDLNRDPLVAEAAFCFLFALGDTEIVELAETGPDTGVFTASVPSSPGAGPTPGVLDNAAAGVLIRAAYTDGEPVPGTSRFGEGYFGVVGALTIRAADFRGRVGLTLVDPDAVTRGGSAPVTVFAGAGGGGLGGDSLEVLLAPAAGTPGTFEGGFLVTDEAAGPGTAGRLAGVIPGTVLLAVYNDTSPEATVRAEAVVAPSDTGKLFVSPASLRAGTELQVTLIDADLDVDPTAVDTATVSVSSSDAAEGVEVVAVTETAPATGLFTGRLPTRVQAGRSAAGDGGMHVREGDTLTATYQDAAPFSAVSSAVPVTASARGVLEVASAPGVEEVGVGGVVVVTLRDADLDTDPNTLQQAEAHVEVDDGGGGVVARGVAALTETNTDSGVFTGAVPTAAGGAGGLLPVAPRQGVTVVYRDEAPSEVARRRLVVVGSTPGLVSAGPPAGEVVYDAPAGLVVRQVAAGDTVLVTVTDADADADPQAADSLSAYFISTRSADRVTVPLTETGDSTGAFTGRLLTLAAAPGAAVGEFGADGAAMIVAPGDKLTCVYLDNAPAARLTGGVIVRVASPGRLELSPPQARPGTVFRVTLHDADLDVDGLALEQVNVTASTSRPGEGQQRVLLTETSPSAGVFTGEVRTNDRVSVGMAETGYLNALEGESVVVSYADASPAGSAEARSLVTVSPCGCAVITADPPSLSAGADLGITVADPDRDLDPLAAEAVSVRVSNVDRPAQVYVEVVLTESGPSTGLFTAALRTLDSVFQEVFFVGPRDVINLSPGEALSASYTNVLPTGPVERAVHVPVKIIGTLAAVPPVVLPGGTCRVVVEDEDRDTTGGRDEVIVVVTSSRGAAEPVKTVTLLETGPRTGVFEGDLYTGDSPASAPPDQFKTVNVAGGERLTLVYTDTEPSPLDIPALLTIAIPGAIDVMPKPLREDSVARVSLADADANADASAPDMATVTVAPGGGPGVSLELTETGPDTARFTGALTILTAPPPAGGGAPGTLHGVRFGDVLTFSYADPHPALTVAQSVQVLDAASGVVHTPPTFRAGGVLPITVYDADINGPAPDTVHVTAETPGQAPVGLVLAKPTPLATRFDGHLPTHTAGSAEGSLLVAAGSVVTVTYEDTSPIGTVSNASTAAPSSPGSVALGASRFAAGGTVQVTVTDSDLDADSGAPDAASVLAVGPRPTDEPTSVALRESGDSTGVFTGTLSSLLWGECALDTWGCGGGSVAGGAGAPLYVAPGQSVTLRYSDEAPLLASEAELRVCTEGSVEVHPLVAAVGWTVTLTVRDPDQVGAGAVNVTVVCLVGGDTERVTLSESPSQPGLFAGSLGTTGDASEAPHHSGGLHVPSKSSVLARYADSCPGRTVEAFLLANILGSISLSASTLKVGAQLGITVTDRQLSPDPLVAEGIRVRCRGTGGDEQPVNLTETGVDTGVFTGFATPGKPGSVSGEPGNEVLCTHDSLSPPMILQQAALMEASAVGVVTLNPPQCKVGAAVSVTVVDSDLDVNRFAVESYPTLVTLSTPTGSVAVPMTETADGSGVFTGTALTRANATAAPGELGVVAGQTLTASYPDLAPFEEVAAQVPVTQSFAGAFTIDPSPVGLSGVPRILVSDPDLNADPTAVETSVVTVDVQSVGSGGNGICDLSGACYPMQATVNLTEMGSSAQFFTGVLVTVGVPDAMPMDGLAAGSVNVMTGYELTFTYLDEAPRQTLTERTSIVASSTGSVMLFPNPTVSGQPLDVTLTDPDLNSDPLILLTAEVSYSVGPVDCAANPTDPDCLLRGSITVTQTAVGSDSFTGVVYPYTVGEPDPCELRCIGLPTAEGAFINFTYADNAPAAMRTATVKMVSQGSIAVDRVGVGGSVVVTLTDLDLDVNASFANTAQVNVSRFGVTPGPDTSRLLTVTETGPSTGTFTGSLLTASAAAASFSPAERAALLPDVVVGSSIRVYYDDRFPGRTVVADRTVLTSVLGALTLTSDLEQVGNVVLRGSTAYVSLADSDVNVDPLRVDAGLVTVSVDNSTQGVEELAVVETAADTGVFTALMRLTWGTINGAAGDGAVDIAYGDVVRFLYRDAYPDVDVVATLEVASVGELDINPKPITAGLGLTVTVTDEDLNTTPSPDAGTVTLETSTDTEVVAVVETGGDTGVFTGEIMTQGEVASVPGNLTGLAEGSLVVGMYRDLIPDSNFHSCPLCNRAVLVASTANVTIFPALLDVNGQLAVTVVDRDANLGNLAVDSFTINVTQSYRLPVDTKFVTVTETGPDTSVFTGSLFTSEDVLDTSTLYAPQGSRIEARYFDANPAPSTVRISESRIASVGSVSLSPSPLNPDGLLLITVDDADLDTTAAPDSSGLGAVVAFSPLDVFNPQGHSVLLLENGPATGVFTGEIQTNTAPGTAASVTIDSSVSRTEITVTYSDLAPAGDRTDVVRIASVGSLVANPPAFESGADILITVTDWDLNYRRAVVDTYQIAVNQSSGGLVRDTEQVTLTETGADTGVFTALLLTSGTDAAGVLHAPPGSDVTIEYTDEAPTPPTTTTITRRVAIGGTLGVTWMVPSGANPECVVVPSGEQCTTLTFSNVFVSVTDSDVPDGSTPTVKVYNTKGLESETFAMAPDSVGSTTFIGNLPCAFSASEGTSGDGTLSLDEGDVIQVSYSDAAPAREVFQTYTVPRIGRVTFVGSLLVVGAASAPLTVQLVDSAVQGTVTVTTDLGLDSETVSLSATSAAGTFTGSIPTSPALLRGATQGDGVLTVRPGETVQVLYVDTQPPASRGMQWSGASGFLRNRGVLYVDDVISPDGTISVTVGDADLSASATTQAQGYATLTSAGGETVELLLAENGTSTGWFKGSVVTSTREAGVAGVLGKALPGTYVEVAYLDCSDNFKVTARVKVAAVPALSFGAGPYLATAGLPVEVTLVDTNLDVTANAESATVTVSLPPGGDSEDLAVLETGGSTGVFTGQLHTVRAAGAANDGRLNGARGGAEVAASFTNPLRGDSASASMRFTTEAGVTTIAGSATPFVAGSPLVVTVVDGDLNTDPYATEVRAGLVAVSLLGGGDSEAVTLTEVERDSDTFTGLLPTSVSASRNASNDGALHTPASPAGGAVAVARYTEQTPAGAPVPDSCSSFGLLHPCGTGYAKARSDGALETSFASALSIGAPVTVTVLDGDLDADFTSPESASVSVSAPSGAFNIAVTETGNSTGTFTGTLETAAGGTTVSPRVVVAKGDAVTLQIAEAAPPRTLSKTLASQYLGSLSSTFNVLLPGGTLFVTLQDADLNANTNLAETVSTVVVQSEASGQREVVLLTETGSNTGVFVGMLETRDDAARAGDFTGAMHVVEGAVLTVSYQDTAPARLIQRMVRVATVGELSRSPISAFVGGLLSFTVTDPDVDRDAAVAESLAGAFQVSIRGQLTDQALTLLETGPSTGTFTAAVTLTSGANDPANSLLGPVFQGTFLTVKYRDEFPLNFVEIRIPVFQKGTVEVNPSPAVDLATQGLTVTVTDNDLNLDPLVAEQMGAGGLVHVTNGLPPNVVDYESLLMMETGADTGVFTGSLPLRDDSPGSPGVDWDSGVLSPVSNAHTITATYRDMAPSQSATATTQPGNSGVLTISPALLGSGVDLTVTVSGDDDLDLDKTAPDTTTVLVASDRTREGTETLTLTETGVASSVFTGSLPTKRTAAFSAADDGVMNLQSGTCDNACSNCASGGCVGYVSVTYVDTSPAATRVKYAAIGTIGTITGCTGGPATDFCTFDSGQVLVTVQHPNLNTNPSQAEIYSSIVKATSEFYSHSTGQLISTLAVNVPIYETAASSSTWTGVISTQTTSTPGQLQIFDTTLLTAASTVVTLTLDDDTSGFPIDRVRLKTTGTITITSPSGSSTLPVGQAARITVTDGDMDYTRDAPDTVQVTVTAKSDISASGIVDTRVITLTETAASSSVFTGEIGTAVGNPRCDAAVLGVYSEAGMLIKAAYDELAPIGLRTTSPALTPSWPGVFDIVENVTFVTDTITVTLTDRDLVGGANPQISFTSTDPTASITDIILAPTSGGAETYSGTIELTSTLIPNVPTGTNRTVITAHYTDASHAVTRLATTQLASRGVLEIRGFTDVVTEVFVTLYDSTPDVTDLPDAIPSSLVSVTTSAPADTEPLALTETGPSTATFTGVISVVDSSSPTASNGVLETTVSKTVTVTYMDQMPTATVTADALVTCTSALSIPATFQAGANITVRVSDCDLSGASSVSIAVSKDSFPSDVPSLALVQEAGASSTGILAAWVGNITTSTASPCSETVCGVVAGALQGTVVTVTYDDGGASKNASSTADVLGVVRVTQTFNGITQLNNVYRIGELVTVTVEDRDADLAPLAPDTVSLTATTAAGDSESLILTETGNSTGVFTGKMRTHRTATLAVGDGRISPVRSGTLITVTYHDQSPLQDVSEGVLGSDYGGVTVAAPVQPFEGALVSVTVTDSDWNTNGGSADVVAAQLSVRATTSVDAFVDLEAVTLTETGLDSEVFTGTVAITTNLATKIFLDGVLFDVCEGLATCIVTATYSDPAWGAFTATAANTRAGTIAAASAQPGATGGALRFVAGEELTVTVSDADLNAQAGAAETTTILVAPSGGAQTVLTLTETAASSGVFTGSIATHTSDFPLSRPGVGPLSGGDTVTFTYADAAPSGHTASAALTANARASVASLPLPATHANTEGGNLTLTVTDASLASSSDICSVSIYATGAGITAAGPVVVVLTAGVSGSGVYTGTVLTTSDLASTSEVPYNGLGDWAYRAVYPQAGTSDASRPAVYRRRATDGALSVSPAGSLRGGGLLRITVSDADMDADWGAPDTVAAVVSSDKRHEMPETVTLTETGDSTGAFTGQVPTVLQRTAGGADDGCVNVVVGDTLTATYSDAYSSNGTAASASESVAVTEGGAEGTVRIVDASKSFQESVVVIENSVVQVVVNDSDAMAPSGGSVEVSCGGGTPLSRELANFTAVSGTEYFSSFTISAGAAVASATVGGCRMGAEVRAVYRDVLPWRAVTAYGVVNRRATLEAGPDPIGMSESLHITVTDADLDENALAADAGVATVRSSRGGEGSEAVPLTETGASTGVFTGVTRTVLSGLAGAADSGGLNVDEGDRLTVTYQERALGSSVLDPLRAATATVLVGRSATVEATPVIQAGTSIQITVVDEDLPLTAPSGSSTVRVTTDKDGESESVNITRVGLTSTYVGTLETCTRCTAPTGCSDLCLAQPCPCLIGPCTMNCPSELEGVSDDGVLYTERGDLVTVTYDDPMPLASYTAFTHVARTGTLEVIPSQFLVGGEPISIILVTGDLNNDPARPETAVANVLSTKVGLSGKSVTLTEDGPTSGRFTGSIETRMQEALHTSSDPFFAVEEGDSLEIVWDYFSAATGEIRVSTVITVAYEGRVAACSLLCSNPETGAYGRAEAGDSIVVEVTDQDLSSALSAVNVTVHLDPNPFADFESVALSYAGAGVFRANLTTNTSATAPNDGSLSVPAGAVVSFYYDDAIPSTQRVARVRIAQEGAVEARPLLVNGFPVLSITLTDQDLNSSPSLREAATVTVSSPRYTADGVAGVDVSLIESGADTGSFVGSLNLLKSESVRSSGNDGVFRGMSGDVITVSYADALPVGTRAAQLPLSFAGTLEIPYPVLSGNLLFVLSVTDADLDTDPLSVDSAAGLVTLTSDSTPPDSVAVTVTQTGPASGVFTAHVMPRVQGAGEDPLLVTPLGAYGVRVVKGGTLTASYASGADSFTRTSGVHMRGSLSLVAGGGAGAGEGLILVTLTDFDLDGVAEVPIFVASARGGSASVSLNATSPGAVTFTGSLPVAASPLPPPAGGLSLADSEGVSATYADALPFAEVVASVKAPNPRFVVPTPDPGASFDTAADCDLQIPLSAADLTPESERLQGSSVYITAVSHRVGDGPSIPGLIDGAALEDNPPSVRYSTTLSWRPSRQQEGLHVTMCFGVAEGHALVVPDTANHTARCITVDVVKCRKCVAPGESLDSIARLLGTHWRVIWSANPGLLDPTGIQEGQALTTALRYATREGDSLASVAMRFGTSVRILLDVNPTLSADSVLATGDVMCIVVDVERYDMCPEQPKSSTWEPLDEQYIAPDYFDNPYNWEYVSWDDPRGQPIKERNIDYPQLPAQIVGQQPGYSL